MPRKGLPVPRLKAISTSAVVLRDFFGPPTMAGLPLYQDGAYEKFQLVARVRKLSTAEKIERRTTLFWRLWLCLVVLTWSPDTLALPLGDALPPERMRCTFSESWRRVILVPFSSSSG